MKVSFKESFLMETAPRSDSLHCRLSVQTRYLLPVSALVACSETSEGMKASQFLSRDTRDMVSYANLLYSL